MLHVKYASCLLCIYACSMPIKSQLVHVLFSLPPPPPARLSLCCLSPPPPTPMLCVLFLQTRPSPKLFVFCLNPFLKFPQLSLYSKKE